MNVTITIDRLYDYIYDITENFESKDFSKQELLELQRCLKVLEEYVKAKVIEQSIFNNKGLMRDINNAINKLKQTEKNNEKGKDIELLDAVTKSKEERETKREYDGKEQIRDLKKLLEKSANTKEFIKEFCKEELKSEKKYQQLVDRCASCFKKGGKIKTIDNQPLFSEGENFGIELENKKVKDKTVSNDESKSTTQYKRNFQTMSLQGYEPNFEALNRYRELVEDPQLLRELYQYAVIVNKVIEDNQKISRINSQLAENNNIQEDYIQEDFIKVDKDIQELIRATNDYIDINVGKFNVPAKDNKFIRLFNNTFRKKKLEKDRENKILLQKAMLQNKIKHIIDDIDFHKIESPIYERIYKIYEILSVDSTESNEIMELSNKENFLSLLGKGQFDDRTSNLMYIFSNSNKIENSDIKRYIEFEQDVKQRRQERLLEDKESIQYNLSIYTDFEEKAYQGLSDRAKEIMDNNIYDLEDLLTIGGIDFIRTSEENKYGFKQNHGVANISEYTALVILNILEECKNNRQISQETLQQLIQQGDITKEQNQEWQETAEKIGRMLQGKLKNINSER